MIRTVKNAFACMAAAILLCSCSSDEESGKDYVTPERPDYGNESAWYRTECSSETMTADVFYITPTCIWDYTDENGDTVHFMDISDEGQRKAVDASNLLAYNLFRKNCRFYSPYYRQISMNSWFEPDREIERRYAIAHEDIEAAFSYYMKNLNGGRPFIIAGHSQGAKAVIELLKHTMDSTMYRRMVAAYVFGYEITDTDLAEGKFLVPATGPDDTGVTVCYNSVSDISAVSPLMDRNKVCINPLNWKTDGTHAPASCNPGAVFFTPEGVADTLKNACGAKIDPAAHALLVDGLDANDFYIPEIGKLFPKGNFHIQEINLYFLSLQENISDRIETFSENTKH